MNSIELKTRLDNKSKTRFIDFVVDGESLFDLFKIEGTERVGSLGWGLDKEYQKRIVLQYLNEKKNNELKSQRIMLFVCSDCGDIGCGGTTFKLSETDTEIIWEEFGYENTYEIDLEVSEYKKIACFKFEKTDYKKLFTDYLNSLK